MSEKYKYLSDEHKAIVDTVVMEFSDMFDNNDFGPFIQEFTNFDEDRYVQLLDLAIGDVELAVNIASLNWSLETYPLTMGSARRCLSLALTIEVIRHLMRSYVEIPDTSRVGAPDIVRRDYLTRWQGLLNDYQNQLKDGAKKLEADLYNNGHSHFKTLVDLNSMRGVITIDQPAERPQYGWWW